MGRAEDVTATGGVNGYRIILGICHLGSQETAPDQLVEPVLVLCKAVLDLLGI